MTPNHDRTWDDAVTQASLRSDEASRSHPSLQDPSVAGLIALGTEVTLWILGLTSMTLVFASLMLLGLLVQGAISDPAASGFLAALALVAFAVGLAVVTYVLSLARRAGYLGILDAGDQSAARRAATIDAGLEAGLVVAPTIPAGYGAMKRREQRAKDQARSQQARAIASAEAARSPSHQPSPWSAGSVSAPARPIPPRPARPQAPRPPRVTLPARSSAARGASRPPGGATAFLRMSTRPTHPRVQPAIDQVRAAETRRSGGELRPWSVIETADGAHVYQPPTRDAA